MCAVYWCKLSDCEVLVIFHYQSKAPGRFLYFGGTRLSGDHSQLIVDLALCLSHSTVHICCSERSIILCNRLSFFQYHLFCFLSPPKFSLHETATPLHSRGGVAWVMRWVSVLPNKVLCITAKKFNFGFITQQNILHNALSPPHVFSFFQYPSTLPCVMSFSLFLLVCHEAQICEMLHCLFFF